MTARIALAAAFGFALFFLGTISGEVNAEPRPAQSISTKCDVNCHPEETPGSSLENEALPAIAHIHAAGVLKKELDRQAEAAAAAARAQAAQAAQAARRTTSRSNVPASGPCAEAAPEGFPGYIINRESGGNPDAVNSSSGAAGCAQILPEHFSNEGFGTGAPGSCSAKANGGVQLTYSACWAKLWAGGAGSSHWASTR